MVEDLGADCDAAVKTAAVVVGLIQMATLFQLPILVKGKVFSMGFEAVYIRV